MASGSESDKGRSTEPSLSESRSRSNTPSLSSTAEIDYCIRTLNYLILTLRLPIMRIQGLEDLTMEILIRIHCALLGIDFSRDFIPSTHPKDDAERMILSLKDRFGTDQFGALEGGKIAAKNPTQLRFLLENFHLILNHQLSKSNKSKTSRSKSGNHLSVEKPSLSDVTQADSFYIFPKLPQGDKIEEGTMSRMKSETHYTPDDTDDSFQTVENIVVNIYEESTSPESVNDLLHENSKNSVARSGTPSEINSVKPPLTSSRSVSRSSGIRHSPNLSSIQKNRSVLPSLQQTINSSSVSSNNSSKSSGSKNPKQNRSFNKSLNTTFDETKEVSYQSNKFSKNPIYVSTSRDTTKSGNELDSTREAKMSDSDIYVASDNESDYFVEKVRELHKNIRHGISESLISLDKDMANLRRKQPKAVACESLSARRPPTLDWFMPVDSRFPSYHRGVIIPQCTSWRSSTKMPAKAKNSSKFSSHTQRASKIQNVVEQELFLYE